MAQVKFYLHKRGKSKVNLPVLLKYTYSPGKRLEYYTGLHGDVANYRIKYYAKQGGKPFKEGSKDADYLNTELERIRGYLHSIEGKAKANEIELSASYFRDELDLILKPTKIPESQKKDVTPTFMEVFDNYIERCKVSTNKNGHRLSEALPIKYTTVRNMLKDFIAYRGAGLNYNDFDASLYDELVEYMICVKKYSINTYGRTIKFIKTVLNHASHKGYNNSSLYKDSFIGRYEDSDSIYLTEDELSKIYAKDFSTNTRLDKVRDLFLIGCWTGLRYSDFTTIKKEDIKTEQGKIRVKNQKTKQKVVIPIHNVVQKILEKYNYQLPDAISNQKFNDYLKEVAEAAEINDLFTKKITKGGALLSITKPKHEFVSSHVARRSFATNAFKRGVEPLLIMAITGHKTEKEFLKYIKISEEEKADLFVKSANWQ